MLKNASRPRVLVTGATGFVGANLVRHLVRKNLEVHVFARSESKLWRLDSLQKKIITHNVNIFDYAEVEAALEKIQPQTVYHLLAYGTYPFHKDDELVIRTNIGGSVNLFRAAQVVKSIKVIVSTGSSSEYGVKTEPMKEGDRPEPNSLYGVAKLSQSFFGQYFSRFGQVPIITLRLFSAYGPYEEPGRLFPSIVTSFIKKEPLKLSSPMIRRDFVYIDDVVRAMEMAGGRPDLGGEIFNIGFGQDHSIKEMTEVAEKVFKTEIPILWGAAPTRSFDTNNRWQADLRKVEKMLKWKPRYSPAEGFQKSLKWFRDNLKFYEHPKA